MKPSVLEQKCYAIGNTHIQTLENNQRYRVPAHNTKQMIMSLYIRNSAIYDDMEQTVTAQYNANICCKLKMYITDGNEWFGVLEIHFRNIIASKRQMMNDQVRNT